MFILLFLCYITCHTNNDVGVDKVLHEDVLHMSTAMPRTQGLRPTEMTKPSPGQTQGLPLVKVMIWTVYAENINHSFLLPGDCSLTLLPRRPLQISWLLLQPYIANNLLLPQQIPCSTVYNTWSSFWAAGESPSERMMHHQNPTFLSFLHYLLPQ